VCSGCCCNSAAGWETLARVLLHPSPTKRPLGGRTGDTQAWLASKRKAEETLDLRDVFPAGPVSFPGCPPHPLSSSSLGTTLTPSSELQRRPQQGAETLLSDTPPHPNCTPGTHSFSWGQWGPLTVTCLAHQAQSYWELLCVLQGWLGWPPQPRHHWSPCSVIPELGTHTSIPVIVTLSFSEAWFALP
jgi:hypothetical protein